MVWEAGVTGYQNSNVVPKDEVSWKRRVDGSVLDIAETKKILWFGHV